MSVLAAFPILSFKFIDVNFYTSNQRLVLNYFTKNSLPAGGLAAFLLFSALLYHP